MDMMGQARKKHAAVHVGGGKKRADGRDQVMGKCIPLVGKFIPLVGKFIPLVGNFIPPVGKFLPPYGRSPRPLWVDVGSRALPVRGASH